VGDGRSCVCHRQIMFVEEGVTADCHEFEFELEIAKGKGLLM